jgi:hypothetical protein
MAIGALLQFALEGPDLSVGERFYQNFGLSDRPARDEEVHFTDRGGGTRDGTRPTVPLGLSVSLIWGWRRYHAVTSHAGTRATRRSPAHTPYPSLTHKPCCATCEDGVQEQTKAPPAAPSPIVTMGDVHARWTRSTISALLRAATITAG